MICAYCGNFKVHSFYRFNYCSKTCLELSMKRRENEELAKLRREWAEQEAHRAAMYLLECYLTRAKDNISRKTAPQRVALAEKIGFVYNTPSELTPGSKPFVDATAKYLEEIL